MLQATLNHIGYQRSLYLLVDEETALGKSFCEEVKSAQPGRRRPPECSNKHSARIHAAAKLLVYYGVNLWQQCLAAVAADNHSAACLNQPHS